jgi:hypothetical protein
LTAAHGEGASGGGGTSGGGGGGGGESTKEGGGGSRFSVESVLLRSTSTNSVVGRDEELFLFSLYPILAQDEGQLPRTKYPHVLQL